MPVKLDHFPKVRGENKKSLKPPPSFAVTSSDIRSFDPMYEMVNSPVKQVRLDNDKERENHPEKTNE